MPVPILKNVAGQSVNVALFDSDGALLTNPTIAAGDFQLSLDDAAFGNPATLPATTPAASGQVLIALSQAETNVDKLGIRWIDQAGAEWMSGYMFVKTSDVGIGSLDTGAITTVTFGAGAIDAAALATDAVQEIADTTLGRDWTAVAVVAARSLLNAARFSRNRWRIAGGTLFVYEEDDVTIAWQGPATTAVSNPVVEVDPT